MASGSASIAALSRSTWLKPPGIASRCSLSAEVAALSLCLGFIGSVPGFPVLLTFLWSRARRLPPDGTSEDDAKFLKQKKRAWAVFGAAFAAYMAIVLMPIKRRPGLIKTYPFKSLLEYLSVRYVYEGGQPLPAGPGAQYMFAFAPHGLYPFSGACAAVSGFTDVFFNFRGAVASAALWVPGLRHLMGWVGCLPATPAAMSAALKAGDSVGLYPGGIAEMLRTSMDSENLVLEPRKGFVKLAIEHGVPLVPVYVFGQSTLWAHLQLPAWVENISRNVGVSLIIPWGRFFLAPRKQQLLFAIGAPIATGGGGPADPAHVDAVHRAFIDSIRRLYDTNKAAFGWAGREMLIT